MILSSDSMNISRVWDTIPSVEFSTGTTPYWARPFSTSSKTAGIDFCGTSSAERPNCCIAAMWVKVALGPKKATFIGASRASEAEMISRKIART